MSEGVKPCIYFTRYTLVIQRFPSIYGDFQERNYPFSKHYLIVTILDVTVVTLKRIISTAVFEYFPAQITVVGACFAGFDCHQAIEK